MGSRRRRASWRHLRQPELPLGHLEITSAQGSPAKLRHERDGDRRDQTEKLEDYDVGVQQRGEDIVDRQQAARGPSRQKHADPQGGSATPAALEG